MFGSGNNSFQQNRKQLASKRIKFKRNSKNSAYSDKNVILKVKTKPISKAKSEDAIEKIQRQAKKDLEKLISMYVIVFTIIVALFIWIIF